MIPGEYHLLPDDLTMNAGYDAIEVECKNDGDRPIQIGSHFHFYEVNSALTFDRKLAWGKWLDIAAGTAVRFEAGESKKVPLVDMGGKRRCYGFNDLVNGFLNDDSNIE